MIETIAIAAIFAGCGLLTWTAMRKYNVKIQRRLDEIDDNTAAVEMAKRQPRK